jgi:hypothetical protein
VVVGSCKRVGHGGQCLCGAGEEQQQKIVVVEPKLSCRNKCAKTTITTVATAAPSRPHQHRRKYDPFATHRKQSQWQQSISAEIRSDLTSLPVCTAHTHTHTHTHASCAQAQQQRNASNTPSAPLPWPPRGHEEPPTASLLGARLRQACDFEDVQGRVCVSRWLGGVQ